MKPNPQLSLQSEMDIELITPEKATLYLKGNSENRPLSKNAIERYCHIMNNDEWRLNGESLKFDIAGNLLDGQHRLHAVIKSGKSVEMYVVRGLERNVFDTLDTGKVRGARDILALKGETHYTILSTVLRLIIFDEVLDGVKNYQKGMNRLITNHDLLECLSRHPEVRESCSFIANLKIGRLAGLGLLGYCHYRFSKLDSIKANSFFTKLSKGSDLQEDSPILALRNKFMVIDKNSAGGRVLILACTIKAWNFYRKNKPSSALRWQEGEDFPNPI